MSKSNYRESTYMTGLFWDFIGGTISPNGREVTPMDKSAPFLTPTQRGSIIREICSYAFALSKPEDTAPHFLYAIGVEEFVKIGVAESVEARLESLQAGNHRKLTVFNKWKLRDKATAYRAEATVHDRLSYCNEHREWFKFDDGLMRDMRKAKEVYPGNTINPFQPPTEEDLQWWIVQLNALPMAEV